MASGGDRPSSDVVEISLFGPGIGECVVVHLGCDDWLIVDSCRMRGERPVALTYLDSLGVDPASVRVVVASHWHDDHVDGLRETFLACENAEFWCSAALGGGAWTAYVESHEDRTLKAGSGVDEFREILRDLSRKGRPPGYAHGNALLWRRADAPACSLWALSPSSSAIHRTLRKLSQAAVKPGEPKGRLTSLDLPNQVSVALWLSVGACSILLGGDVEESGSPGGGWSAILQATTRVWEGGSDLVKVPHHGSRTGHHDGMWSEMVNAEGYALVAPNYQGRRPLPSDDDRARINAQTPNAYITVSRPPNKHVKRREIDKHLARWGKRPVTRRVMGHVRMRADASAGIWTVEAPPPAARL